MPRSSPLGVQYPERSLLQCRREQVKSLLLHTRRPFGIPHNICPICRKPVVSGDLHEVILTRGNIQKLPDEIKLMAHTPENCIFVHSGGCHIKAATREGSRLCLFYLFAWEGYDAIFEWLDAMSKYMNVAEEIFMVRSVGKQYTRIRNEYMAYWYNGAKMKQRKGDNYVYSWSRPGDNFSR